MMRYRLRTLLIVLAILPPLLAAGWWKYAAWKAEQERQRAAEIERTALSFYIGVIQNDLRDFAIMQSLQKQQSSAKAQAQTVSPLP